MKNKILSFVFLLSGMVSNTYSQGAFLTGFRDHIIVNSVCDKDSFVYMAHFSISDLPAIFFNLYLSKTDHEGNIVFTKKMIEGLKTNSPIVYMDIKNNGNVVLQTDIVLNQTTKTYYIEVNGDGDVISHFSLPFENVQTTFTGNFEINEEHNHFLFSALVPGNSWMRSYLFVVEKNTSSSLLNLAQFGLSTDRDIFVKNTTTRGKKSYVSAYRTDILPNIRTDFFITFDHTLQLQKLYDMNFEIISMNTAGPENLIFLCKQNEHLVVMLTDENLNTIWSKKITFTVTENIVNFNNKKIAIDSNDNIYILLNGQTGESDFGLNLIKLDTNGNLLENKIILDNQNSGTYKLEIFGNYLIATSSLSIRKIPLNFEITDCLTMNSCHGLTDYPLAFRDAFYQLVLMNSRPLIEINIFNLEDASVTTVTDCSSFSEPVASFSLKDQQLCPDETLETDHVASESLGYSSWYLINPNGDSIYADKISTNTFTTDMPGDYVLGHYIFFAGCTYHDTAHFEVLPEPLDLLKNTYTFCEDSMVSVSLPPGTTSLVLWNDSIAGPERYFNTAGEFTVTYLNEYDCPHEETISIIQTDKPVFELPGDTILCDDNIYEITIPIKFNETVSWSDNTQGPKKRFTEEGIFVAYVRNECGERSDDIGILYEDCTSEVHLSNVFSPESTSENNQFLILTKNISNVTVTVYDRWGNMVWNHFSQNGGNITWSGEHRGQMLVKGVYVLTLVYTENKTGITKFLSGDITVI